MTPREKRAVPMAGPRGLLRYVQDRKAARSRQLSALTNGDGTALGRCLLVAIGSDGEPEGAAATNSRRW